MEPPAQVVSDFIGSDADLVLGVMFGPAAVRVCYAKEPVAVLIRDISLAVGRNPLKPFGTAFRKPLVFFY